MSVFRFVLCYHQNALGILMKTDQNVPFKLYTQNVHCHIDTELYIIVSEKIISSDYFMLPV